MIRRLREKAGGEALDVREGDFSDAHFEESYALIYVIWNSFFNLLTQESQKRCFRNVAASLSHNGLFLIEAFVPGTFHRLEDHQQVATESIETDQVRIGVLRHDPAQQTIEQNHVTLSGDGLRFDPVVQRYAWPAELDLMAELAGLRLKYRWGGWRRQPFDADSRMHVSVYESASEETADVAR